MAKAPVYLSGVERTFDRDEVIVSKTDPTGRIIYANEIFQRVSGYTERELMGQPHSIIRHPQMPRCVFKLLWDTIESGREIFAYVLNRAKNGDHYWVFAHVTPTLDSTGNITGYHSNRRKPTGEQVKKIAPIYHLLLDEERKHASPKDGLAASTALLQKFLKDKGIGYEEFVFTI